MVQIPNTKYQIPEGRDLVGVIIGGLLLRLVLIPFTNINLDEGNMLFDAKFLWQGLVPYRDFITRSLSYLLPLSLFAKCCDLLTAGMGFSLIIGRIFSALCITFAAYFIFRIGELLFCRRSGLIACALVSFSPAFIYHSYTVNMHSANFAYVTAGVLLLIRALKQSEERLLCFSGILLGLAVLARRSSLLVLAAMGIYLCLTHAHRLKPLARRLALLVLPAAAIVVPVYALLVHLTNWPFILEHGAYGKVARHFLLPILPHHLAVLNNFAVENNYLFLPLSFLLFALSRRARSAAARWGLPIAVLFGLLLLFWLGGLTRPQGGYGARGYPLAYLLLQLAFLAALGVLGCQRAYRLKQADLSGMLFPALWLAALLLTYLSYNSLHIHYLYECLPPIVLIAARLLDGMLSARGALLLKKNKALVACLLLAISVSYGGMYFFFDPAYGWKQSTLRAISRHLREAAHADEEVFTAGTIFALEAGLSPCLRITHPYDYLADAAPYRQWKDSPLPDIPALIRHMERGKVRFIVADQLTYGLIGKYPELLRQVMSNYAPVVDIDNVKIAVRMF